jgi:hypothetical protein
MNICSNPVASGENVGVYNDIDNYSVVCNMYERPKAVCCSLLSSTSSMGRSGELSDFERGLVIGCHISKKLSGTLQPFSSCPSQRLVM